MEADAETAAAPGFAQQGPQRNAAMPLNMAYRVIGGAELLGAHGAYFESAKAHYRSAMARYAKDDQRGAAAEASAASSLARAALAESPPAVPKDLPAPPKPTMAMGSPGGRGPGGPPMGGPPMGGRPPMGGPGGPGGGPRWGGRGIDAAELGELVKLDNSAEVKNLADAAVNASIASQKAALAGNLEESMRQRMLGSSLASATRDIVVANHPEAFQRPSRGPRANPMGTSTSQS
jgi:hypothetical protein